MSNLQLNFPNIVTLLISIKKDSERESAINKIKIAHTELLKIDVTSRRMKTKEIIMEMHEINKALMEFEIHYDILKERTSIDEIEAIEKYINELKKYRNKLLREKKKIK